MQILLLSKSSLRKSRPQQSLAQRHLTLRDHVLGLSEAFTSALLELLASKHSPELCSLHQLGLYHKEAAIIQVVSELSRQSKKSLLEFLPVAECVEGIAALILDPFLELRRHQGEGGVLELPSLSKCNFCILMHPFAVFKAPTRT